MVETHTYVNECDGITYSVLCKKWPDGWVPVIQVDLVEPEVLDTGEQLFPSYEACRHFGQLVAEDFIEQLSQSELDESIWRDSSSVLESLFRALEQGGEARPPDLEQIRSAVYCLIAITDWNGLEPHIRPIRSALERPIVSYVEVAALAKKFLADVAAHRLKRSDLSSVPLPGPGEDDLF